MYRFLAFVLIVLTVPCWARTITVDDDGPADFSDIEDAIDDANNGDIILVADGLYGYGYRDVDFEGKSITVTSENGPNDCILDFSMVRFTSGEGSESTLNEITIRNNIAEAIVCSNASSPTISNCIITDNGNHFDPIDTK